MDRSRLIVFGVAGAVALLAALFVSSMMGGKKVVAAAVPTVVKMPETSVLVAAMDLPIGHKIQPGDLIWQPWPEQGISPSFIRNDFQPGAVTDMVGRYVRRPVGAIEPITNAKVVGADAGYLAATLTPGMKAVSVPITVEAGAGGFILPDDHVDVILTQAITRPRDPMDDREIQRADENIQSRVFLEDVRVLAMDQQVQEIEGSTVVVARTATLELNSRDAELITRSLDAGRLSLVLRAVSDVNSDLGASSRAVGYNPEDEEEQKKLRDIKIVKYGQSVSGAIIQN